MKKVQHINYLGIILYLALLGLGIMCVLSPVFCIMPTFYAICVIASGAISLLGMFYNRRTLWDTLKWTEEIPEESDFAEPEQPTETVIVEELPKPKTKKTTKKKKGEN